MPQLNTAVPARILTGAHTVEQVAMQLTDRLMKQQKAPEFLGAANFVGDDNEAAYGALPTSLWPVPGASDRIAVSVVRGTADSWGIHVDLIQIVGGFAQGQTALRKLLLGKASERAKAWEIAGEIAAALEID